MNYQTRLNDLYNWWLIQWLLSIIDYPLFIILTHRIHGAAIYGNMDPINIPPFMLAYIPAPWILWVMVEYGWWFDNP